MAKNRAAQANQTVHLNFIRSAQISGDDNGMFSVELRVTDDTHADMLYAALVPYGFDASMASDMMAVLRAGPLRDELEKLLAKMSAARLLKPVA